MQLISWFKRKSETKIPLFQFWDNTNPPEEVDILMSSWRDAESFDYQIYNWQTANDFIAKHFEDNIYHAFCACDVPAMQADFFRYCVLYQIGGLYVDADTSLKNPTINKFLSSAKAGILVQKQDRIANDFMFVRTPGNPLIKRVIDIATNNIERRLPHGVWAVTGPGILTALFHDEETKQQFNDFDVRSIFEVKEYVHYQWEMNYKNDQTDWRDFSGEKAATIYRDNTNES